MKIFFISLGLISTLAFIASLYFLGSEKILLGPVALSSVFNGMMALAGFMLTARTFIVFKLNDTIYGTDAYRKYHEELTAQGHDCSPLYRPLKNLDSNLAATCILCLVTLLGVAFFNILPKEWGVGDSLAARISSNGWGGGSSCKCYLIYQLSLCIVYSLIFSSVIRVLYSIVRVNRNIEDIIMKWEEDYNKKQSKGG